jgi:predicted dinucleotide-binding enzyme
MKIGVLGTGMVGTTLATGLVKAGHEVRMGSRAAGGEAAANWAESAGDAASEGTFADAAEFGELCLNCTLGAGAVDAVTAGADGLAGKVLVDVSNPLEFPAEGPPTLFVGLDDSLGERVQRALPDTAVVKALNTMGCDVMVDPDLVGDEHVAFVCGDDDGAKERVVALLGELGWPPERVVDLGDITAARGTEGYLLLWLRLMGVEGGPHFNVAIEREAGRQS